MTTVGYISDMEDIVDALCSPIQHYGPAAFRFSERSPLPLPLSPKDLPGGWTQVLNVRQIRRINRHPVESDQDSAPASISDTDDWLNWNGDLDNPNDREDDCGVDIESDIGQDNSMENLDFPEQRDASAMPNDPA